MTGGLSAVILCPVYPGFEAFSRSWWQRGARGRGNIRADSLQTRIALQRLSAAVIGILGRKAATAH